MLCAGTYALAEGEVKLLINDDGSGHLGLLPDRPMPASKAFTVQYALPLGVEQGSGYLEIWPMLDGPAQCGGPRPTDKPQSRSVALSLTKVDDRPTLQGNVPPLQVDLGYCLVLHTHVGLTAGQLTAIATLSAEKLRGTILTDPEACAAAPVATFEHALLAALSDLNLQADLAREAAASARGEFITKAGDICSRLGEYDLLGREIANVNNAAGAKIKTEAAIDNFVPTTTALSSPLLMVENALVTLETVQASGFDAAKFNNAAAQLRTRFPDWANALQSVIDVADKERAVALANFRRIAGFAGKKATLPLPTELELWDGDDIVYASKLVGPNRDRSKTRTPAVTEKALAILKLAPRVNTELRSLFQNARDHGIAYDAARAAVKQRKTSVASLVADINKALISGFSTPGVAHALRSPDRPMSISTIAGSGETPNKLNYASVDMGMLAAPSGFTTWFVPYVGLNVYLVAVDRTIGLAQLSGSLPRRIMQLVSLTIGATLAPPVTPGYSIQAPFLSTYPIVGIGTRVSNYVRVSGGALFYELGDPDGLSQKKTLNASFFLGLSLDLDVVQLLTQAVGS